MKSDTPDGKRMEGGQGSGAHQGERPELGANPPNSTESSEHAHGSDGGSIDSGQTPGASNGHPTFPDTQHPGPGVGDIDPGFNVTGPDVGDIDPGFNVTGPDVGDIDPGIEAPEGFGSVVNFDSGLEAPGGFGSAKNIDPGIEARGFGSAGNIDPGMIKAPESFGSVPKPVGGGEKGIQPQISEEQANWENGISTIDVHDNVTKIDGHNRRVEGTVDSSAFRRSDGKTEIDTIARDGTGKITETSKSVVETKEGVTRTHTDTFDGSGKKTGSSDSASVVTPDGKTHTFTDRFDASGHKTGSSESTSRTDSKGVTHTHTENRDANNHRTGTSDSTSRTDGNGVTHTNVITRDGHGHPTGSQSHSSNVDSHIRS
ncbi:hypothetical protein ACFW6F_10610 [Streptomyces sp. NPDC058746]|uniref:hypothetical protein n=1 Tax=Streptomyces sp. NPDC058746 TaxID=3346622 RepID=UPI0036C21D51